MPTPVHIAVIGGGSAGLIASIAAARRGARVTVLEKNNRVGKKLLTTGNGTCNLTNTDPALHRYHGENPRFILSAFSRFGYPATIEFFRELGVEPVETEQGKVYPASFQASSVLDLLRYELDALGVEILTEAPVEAIGPTGSGFKLMVSDGRQLSADRVIVATGGLAAPNLGCHGDGYRLAGALGHRLVDPFPALVQLKLDSPYVKQLNGVRLQVEARIIAGGVERRSETGEVLFTNYGVSGPAILQLSRTAGHHLRLGEQVILELNLVPGYTLDSLDQLLAQRLAARPAKSIAFSLVGFIHKQLAQAVAKEAVGDLHLPGRQVTAAQRQRLAQTLLGWRFPVSGTLSWPSAQVTAGGLDVTQVDPRTMESRLVPGLYFAGEVLDIDGDSGGYNLQWAWSSGHVAGESAAQT